MGDTEVKQVMLPVEMPVNSLIADVVMLVNVIDEDNQQRLCLSTTQGMTHSNAIGMLTMGLDRARSKVNNTWN